MAELKGEIVRAPVIQDRVIYSTLQTEETVYQLVCFREYRPAGLIDAVANLQIGDNVTAFGKVETNPRTHETQLILNGLSLNSGRDYQPLDHLDDADGENASLEDSKMFEVPDEF